MVQDAFYIQGGVSRIKCFRYVVLMLNSFAIIEAGNSKKHCLNCRNPGSTIQVYYTVIDLRQNMTLLLIL